MDNENNIYHNSNDQKFPITVVKGNANTLTSALEKDGGIDHENDEILPDEDGVEEGGLEEEELEKEIIKEEELEDHPLEEEHEMDENFKENEIVDPAYIKAT